MERSHPPSGRSATPADINRNGRPTSIGTGGRHQSECPADIIGIRTQPLQWYTAIINLTVVAILLVILIASRRWRDE
jgi:hypothetical protein